MDGRDILYSKNWTKLCYQRGGGGGKFAKNSETIVRFTRAYCACVLNLVFADLSSA